MTCRTVTVETTAHHKRLSYTCLTTWWLAASVGASAPLYGTIWDPCYTDRVNTAKSLWASVQNNPRLMRIMHGWLTIIWFIAAFPIMYFWSENIKFLVFISVYAVVTGHWSSWQAARVEEKQEEQDLR